MVNVRPEPTRLGFAERIAAVQSPGVGLLGLEHAGLLRRNQRCASGRLGGKEPAHSIPCRARTPRRDTAFGRDAPTRRAKGRRLPRCGRWHADAVPECEREKDAIPDRAARRRSGSPDNRPWQNRKAGPSARIGSGRRPAAKGNTARPTRPSCHAAEIGFSPAADPRGPIGGSCASSKSFNKRS